jgi:putative ribosome biogenesis GTPase RsgA
MNDITADKLQGKKVYVYGDSGTGKSVFVHTLRGNENFNVDAAPESFPTVYVGNGEQTDSFDVVLHFRRNGPPVVEKKR